MSSLWVRASTLVASTWFGESMLDMQDKPTLYDCLAAFCDTEEMTGDNQYFCDSCNKRRDAKYVFAMWPRNRTAMILVICALKFRNSRHLPTSIYVFYLCCCVQPSPRLLPILQKIYPPEEAAGNSGHHYQALPLRH